MKISKIILFCAAAIVFSYGAFKASVGTIENINAQYEAENPVSPEATAADAEMPMDIDRTISHTAPSTEETVLPVDTGADYAIYERELFVTVNEGESWIPVPDDTELGYARISDYIDTISRSNIYISGEKVSVAYGGRGPENISILTTDTRGQVWSVGSISRTATHDLEKGYEKMHIDFIDGEQTGFLVALRNEGTSQAETLAFRSVNMGVTWDPVSVENALYDEIMAHFELQGTLNE
ncbi:hypothetical protein [Planomicrobium sp. CPCC 101110]|uniref:hypothetical protein n=1 Tax=Planomicrobium sp. CPCC 101110 TaxID=2599619 RepID=UPI0011B66BE5|nr:hypothetical protein [Planomicrobium sp. CPCC 101110]TWT25294.1 hypothetical protein FQV30_13095 [Planomicrobium sp. CPCC 101110]